MASLSVPSMLALTCWVFCCAMQDARTGRISNELLLFGGIAALLHTALLGRSLTGATPAMVALGCLLSLLFSIPGYWRAKLGGADVKLMLVIALATDPRFVLFTVSGAALFCLLWLLSAAKLWPCLPRNTQTHLCTLAPPVVRPPYAPFVFLGVLCTSLLT